MRISLLIVVLGVSSPHLFGQAFADNGYSAHLTAVGRTGAALINDPALVFCNPASIGFSSSPGVSSSYTNLYPGLADGSLTFLTLSGNYPLGDIGVVGVAVTQFAPTGWSENMMIGTFAMPLLERTLSVGASAKFLRWKADEPKGENAVPEPALSYSGLSFDVGATYVLQNLLQEKHDVRLGVSLLNVNEPSVAASGSADARLPFELQAAMAYISRTYDYSVTLGTVVRGKDVHLTGGAELTGLKTSIMGADAAFLVRVGGGRIVEADRQGEYDGGFGLVVGSFALDYAYTYQAVMNNLGGISTISLRYIF
ncbi:MAG: hypothetical protein NTV54_15735 [Ignavibacteriales bacterium]|nr:hypothetical protein [Ignavibacteriales bacterium]